MYAQIGIDGSGARAASIIGTTEVAVRIYRYTGLDAFLVLDSVRNFGNFLYNIGELRIRSIQIIQIISSDKFMHD